MSASNTAADKTRRGCEGCAHFAGVVWFGETMRIKCALSTLSERYADARVRYYIGCGLRREAGERQRELF